jgi:SAM-dependent methyltransferase
MTTIPGCNGCDRSDSRLEIIDSNEISRIRTVYAQRERTHRSDKDSPARQRLLRERDEALARVLAERMDRPLADCRILDVGCGYGGLLGWFRQRGATPENLFGVDLLPNRIKVARATYPAFTFIEGNAEHLSFPDGWFDLVVVFTVFSSILDHGMAAGVAHDIGRVLGNGGVVVWYDIRYPNPWNPALRAMTKPRIRKLFPRFKLELELLSLPPPIIHKLGRLTEYQFLASIPILRSHYLGLLRPPPNHSNCRPDQPGGRIEQV